MDELLGVLGNVRTNKDKQTVGPCARLELAHQLQCFPSSIGLPIIKRRFERPCLVVFRVLFLSYNH
jgi:hypothetical protein